MPLPLVGKKTPADPFAHCLEDYRRRYYPPGWESDPQKGGDLPVPLPSTPAPKGDAAAPRASPSPPPDPEAKYAPGAPKTEISPHMGQSPHLPPKTPPAASGAPPCPYVRAVAEHCGVPYEIIAGYNIVVPQSEDNRNRVGFRAHLPPQRIHSRDLSPSGGLGKGWRWERGARGTNIYVPRGAVAGDLILFVEGETSSITAAALLPLDVLVVATTSARWPDAASLAPLLAGRSPVLWADNDPAGAEWLREQPFGNGVALVAYEGEDPRDFHMRRRGAGNPFPGALGAALAARGVPAAEPREDTEDYGPLDMSMHQWIDVLEEELR